MRPSNRLWVALLLCCAILFVSNNALEVYTTTPLSDFVNYSGPNTIVSAGGDYVMMFYYSTGSAIAIFKRNSGGYYDLLKTINTASTVSSAATNGDWFSYVLSTGAAQIFQMNGTTIINSSPIANAGSYTSILSDNSVLFLGASSIKTYQFITNSWTLVDTSPVTLTTGTQFPPYHLMDNTLAIYESGTSRVKLYTRSNSSWALQDQFTFSSSVSRIIWTGDTVILTDHANGDPKGVVWIYVKVGNSTWTNTNTTAAADIGVTSQGYLGQYVALLDKDTVAIAAPFDAVSNNRLYDSGSVFLLTRTSTGSWSYSVKLLPRLRGPIYGTSLAVSGRDLLIGQCSLQVDISSNFNLDCSLHALPLCFQQPINVTCNDVTFDTCTTYPDLSAVQMFTVNNPLCGTTTSTLDRVQFSGTSLVVDMTFARDYVASATCNITLTCPEAPVARSPDGTVIPVAQPQSTPSSQVSNAVRYSAALIAGLFLLLLFV
eukprot:TRINITY_DN811_c0_g1_i1.p1 TRINITY_DN811_c0_g1~~TRINITY_DN811_c0_g1_i1.p1  ORF type:complete len:487 (+),score=67.70 TRINITY_DN811_c0_g1_i1:22-1482(+)